MIYSCNLQQRHFQNVSKGSKRFEMRPYRDKWTNINVNDILKISEVDMNNKKTGNIIYCLVKAAIQCSSFRDALEAFNLDRLLPYGNFVSDGLILYGKIYGDLINKKSEVVVFRLKVILD